MALVTNAGQCVRLLVGFNTGGQRWQCNITLGCTVAVSPQNIIEDFSTFALFNSLWLKWRDCLASDTECVGYQMNGMAYHSVIPYRYNSAVGTLVGQIAGNSCPYNASMLIAYHAALAIALPGRIREAKIFAGPPPLSKVNGKFIFDTGFRTNMDAFKAKFLTGLVASSGRLWLKTLNHSNVPGTDIYLCDIGDSRWTTFSQRRRLYPVARG